MVYYKHTLKRLKGGRYDCHDGRNTYWMLGFDQKMTAHELREYLDANDYQYPVNASKAVLMGAVGRHQRGLLGYEKYCAHDLLAFCQARKISVPRKARTPAQIARVLDKADDNATFTRFFDLPAELRTRVYELHFSDYQIASKHRQPPLTLVPRVREEALPSFYGCATFSWGLSVRPRPLGSNPSRFGFFFDYASRELMDMPADMLAQVRNYHIYWAFACRGRGAATSPFDFSARVSQHNNVNKELAIIITSGAKQCEDRLRLILQSQGFGDVKQNLHRVQLCAIEREVNKAVREALGM